jgi:hypothetical protein
MRSSTCAAAALIASPFAVAACTSAACPHAALFAPRCPHRQDACTPRCTPPPSAPHRPPPPSAPHAAPAGPSCAPSC